MQNNKLNEEKKQSVNNNQTKKIENNDKKGYMQFMCCAKKHQALKDIKNGNSLYPTQNT